LTVAPKDYSRLGLMQYKQSLPLNDHEVVLTFDDGPIPPYSDRVLAILAHNCVKATFFLVGRHVAANPAAARRVYAAGHTIGNHSQNHLLHFDKVSEARAEEEVEDGLHTIRAALGSDDAVAPFFRVPGLGRTRSIEKFAQSQSIVVWSADTVADDWTRITSGQVLKRALSRLEARGKGILLLHDIQPRTVLMLQALLDELKKRHFRIVQVVPDRGGAPPPAPLTIAAQAADKLGWPRVASADGAIPAAVAKITTPVTPPVVPDESTEQANPVNSAAPVEHAEPAAAFADIVPLPPERNLKRKLRHRASKTALASVHPSIAPTVFRPDVVF
jgi:peptidoglycan/xylan/chitin deacetylase (PgdA/CDA1 family)